ncbi:hypothetical protein [Arthrobacter globiformis]|uniref:hypothetical protein n=1 Tax=Arthrobacter globiformis TaxID=1665 RepID=UPI000B417851|nr:hypothetical protein [Arthrobacter globiformis]
METAIRLKGQLAYGSRRDVGYAPERLAALRRDYQAARLAESIRRIVQESGPFTTEQAEELTNIITGSAADTAA